MGNIVKMFRKYLEKIWSWGILRKTFKIGLGMAVILFLSSFLFKWMAAKPIDATIDSDIRKRSLEEVIQVNILNACGEPGAASEVMHYLRRMGFDVVEIGNYGKTLDNSIVIDRVGDRNSAEKIAYALGVDGDEITTKIDSSLFLRCTIVIGDDYKSLKLFD